MAEGFIYPNEEVIQWGIMIALYPYFTGLHTGPLLTSAVHYTFGVKKVKPLARLALVTATAFVVVSILPLILHLTQPARGFEIFWTPHISSAMAIFGYIYLTYLLVLLLAVYFDFRTLIVAKYSTSKGFKRLFYYLLCLGQTRVDEDSLRVDKLALKVLLLIGIPLAAVLHGYVGFIFGGSTANTWWRSPLMPVIFLTSGLISGIALLILIYYVSCRFRGTKIDVDAVTSISKVLWVILVVNTSFEILEIIQKRYEFLEEWPLFERIITTKLAISYLGVQFILGSEIPILLLALAFVLKHLSPKVKEVMIGVSSILILIGVLAMRYNVVIGGQLYSKTIMGTVDFEFELWGPEGLIAATGVFIAPFILLYVVSKILNPWEEAEEWAENVLKLSRVED